MFNGFDDDHDDEFGNDFDRKSGRMIAENPLATLPELAEGQSFSCAQCGADNIKPKHHKNVYQSSFNPQTNELIEKSEMVYISKCCLADLMVWDENLKGFIGED